MNKPSHMAGEDIEVTELMNPLFVDQLNGKNLITRRLSRGVVADCFETSEKCSTYAISGSPGIGKSRTLIYTSQQALLYKNVCVLFCFQKERTALICIRRNNKIYVWKHHGAQWLQDCDSNLFLNSNVLVLLDPQESSEGGAKHALNLRMLIMVTSNNVKHFLSASKTTPKMDRILKSLYREGVGGCNTLHDERKHDTCRNKTYDSTKVKHCWYVTAVHYFRGYRKVYQVIVSNRHDMSIKGLTKLFLSSGHCVVQNKEIVKYMVQSGLTRFIFTGSFHRERPPRGWIRLPKL